VTVAGAGVAADELAVDGEPTDVGVEAIPTMAVRG
jgi:hypothetical protein